MNIRRISGAEKRKAALGVGPSVAELEARIKANAPTEMMDRARRQVARQLGIDVSQVSRELLAEHRCLKQDARPKVPYDTLRESKGVARQQAERVTLSPYPCKACISWHLTSNIVTPPVSFTCAGCGLTYTLQFDTQEWCSRGCRRRHNRLRHKAQMKARKA